MPATKYLIRILGSSIVIALCSFNGETFGQENQEKDLAELLPGGNRSCVLAGQESLFTYTLTNANVVKMRVNWSLVDNGRVLASGTSNDLPALAGDADPVGQIFIYSAAIPMPPLRTGVVLPAELRIKWTADKQTFKFKRPIYIYSPDPFASQQEFLKRAQIKLFDPNDKTAELLDDNTIPYTRLFNLAAIDRVAAGIVLVGEGVSFHKQRKLTETLVQAARRGISVLCLAPSEGEFPLILEEDGRQIQSTRLLLERERFVQHYDKRFDTIADRSRLSLTPRRNEVVFGVNDGPDYWSKLSLDFPNIEPETRGGRVLIISSGIVSHWETGPVPRYLFAHFLKELSDLSLTEEK